jgi:hypothetical protein
LAYHGRPAPAPASQLEVFGVPTAKPKPADEKIDVNSVFGKLKEKARLKANRRARPVETRPMRSSRLWLGPASFGRIASDRKIGGPGLSCAILHDA